MINTLLTTQTKNTTPQATSLVEEILVTGFPYPTALFDQLIEEVRSPQQSLIYYLNVHVANSAFRLPKLKRILQQGNLVYCDGAGIAMAAKLLGTPLPGRLTAADWILDLVAYMAEQQVSLYFLGSQPGVPEKALKIIQEKIPNHTVLGAHHGYILKDAELNSRVIDEINQLKPDLVIVGFGTPLQEEWIAEHHKQLNVPAVYAIGAVLDFVTGMVPRCPEWMGRNGLEWLFRLYA